MLIYRPIPYYEITQEGTCTIQLMTVQRYSLAVLCQLSVCWLWSYLYVDSVLAAQFVSWNILDFADGVITRFRDIVRVVTQGTQGQENVPMVPRRRARSWGEEIAQVLG